MHLNSQVLEKLSSEYGEAFYVLHADRFERNIIELKSSFQDIYPKFGLAYSYKTNYIPHLCRIAYRHGLYAEVVSDMELEIALRSGVLPQSIIWNGPYKRPARVGELLLSGGLVNIDSIAELDVIKQIVKDHPDTEIRVGVRCNFDIGDGVKSRFGFDIQTEDFETAVRYLRSVPNVRFVGLHCHFATRTLETWRLRVHGMFELLDRLEIMPELIDLGGGIFGKMPDSLKKQFDSYVPDYKEYAELVATPFSERYRSLPYDKQPLLILEPGTALVGDCMSFVSKVVSIKEVRGKAIATLLGSIYNINPTLNTKNPPITVFHMGGEQRWYSDLDFGGFTCIESDYLYRGYYGPLAQNDMVMFCNVGSYSIVLKPPFILPNFPVLVIEKDSVHVVKRPETFADLFSTYEF